MTNVNAGPVCVCGHSDADHDVEDACRLCNCDSFMRAEVCRRYDCPAGHYTTWRPDPPPTCPLCGAAVATADGCLCTQVEWEYVDHQTGKVSPLVWSDTSRCPVHSAGLPTVRRGSGAAGGAGAAG